jgi:hypothetical protein
MHKSITLERVQEIAEESLFGCTDDGICLACGADAYGVEPDARGYTCEECGNPEVMGAQDLLMAFGCYL